MSFINMLAGPLIGSLIGYVTNYIAVKMLFRPRQPVKIGNFTLPFTPGIIPRRKAELARALGKTVGNNLITGSDLEQMFLNERAKQKILDEIAALLDRDEPSIENMFSSFWGQEDYRRGKVQLENFICAKITSAFTRLNLGEIIVRESARAIKEKTEGTMLAFVANDKLIASMVVPVGKKIESYLMENGQDLIRPIINKEIEDFSAKSIASLLTETGLEKDRLLELVEKVYTQLITTKVADFIRQFDIAGVVEEKINAMDAIEVERLVLSVMKRELNAIINLGALIGFIIGLINLLF
ncbi:MAG: DUF445 family protein [Peptococcaceae bacterium]|nr:DUF445 family protein [Peptococcaceae bacterium]